METELTHIRENNEDTERHLSENREKFETDGAFLIRLMKFGHRLTRHTVVEKYKIDGRRLGEIHSEGKCQKDWKTNEAGKRLYVEYFIPVPKLPTKEEVIEKAHKAMNDLKIVESNLHVVFTLPDSPTDKTYSQQSLF